MTLDKFCAQKCPNKTFWSQTQVFLFFHKILQLDKLGGADVKYNTFFEFQSKNTQKGLFWSKFKNFYFRTKFCILINSGVLISNMAIICQTYSPKLHELDICGPIFENCLFWIKYSLMTYSKGLTSNVTIVLQNSSLQITQKDFCPKFNVFLFLHENLF